MGFHPKNPANEEEQEFLVTPSGEMPQVESDLAYSMNIDWSFNGSPNLNKAYKKAVQPEIEFEALRLGGVE